MPDLNYLHLQHFWAVAKAGGVTAAAGKMLISPSTLSTQIRELETALGHKLFDRVGRSLVLTDAGRVTFRFADEIYAMGRELTDTLAGRPSGGPIKFAVGIADVLPKLVAYRLLKPAFDLPESIQMICYEGRPDELLAKLAVNELDAVLVDSPIGPSMRIRAYSHLLGECGVSFFAAPKLAAACRRGFPKSLGGNPFIMPMRNLALRLAIDHWMEERAISPVVVGEFEDSALIKVFGQHGAGVFAAPEFISEEIQKAYGVRKVGVAEGLRARYYVVSVDRKFKHPAVEAMAESARDVLFS